MAVLGPLPSLPCSSPTLTRGSARRRGVAAPREGPGRASRPPRPAPGRAARRRGAPGSSSAEGGADVKERAVKHQGEAVKHEGEAVKHEGKAVKYQ